MESPDPRKPMEVALDDAVQGWRHWLLTRDRPELYSTQWASQGGVWTPRRTALATCPYGCDRLVVPNPSCSCGFYLRREPGEDPDITPQAERDCIVIPGRAAGWGKVIEGGVGWRTSKAYPTELWVPYGAAWLAPGLKEAYKCKVNISNEVTV